MLIKDYKLGFKLREFKNSKCYIARKEGENYFFKMLEIEKDDDEKISKVETEIECLKKLKHNNIIELKDSFTIEKDGKIIYCLVTEFIEMDLLKYIKKKGGEIKEKKIRMIMQKVLKALLHCQKNNVVHHDIKPENIMIDEKKNKVKLIDFGMSTISKSKEEMEDMKFTIGTPYYM
jgi:serine/threonine protein kinase